MMFIFFVGIGQTDAKKIKNSFKIEKEKAAKPAKGEFADGKEIDGKEINVSDTFIDLSATGETEDEEQSLVNDLRKCSYAGFDKEMNSNIESFILVNPTGHSITGFRVRIDYLDMKGRMLHSRVVTLGCDVPPGENRRFDIKSWDKQHVYYYYLGNPPRRVATPFQVVFTPETFWIKE